MNTKSLTITLTVLLAAFGLLALSGAEPKKTEAKAAITSGGKNNRTSTTTTQTDENRGCLGTGNSAAENVGALYSITIGTGNTATGCLALFNDKNGNSNTANGTMALFQNKSGNNNTATGFNALKNNTGRENTATGSTALSSNTNGGGNTATGFQALYTNTGGSSNTATGHSALYFNTTDPKTGASGDANTADGVQALYNNTTGHENTAVGYGSLNTNGTGYDNTAVGNIALDSNTDGFANVAIGKGAVELSTSANNNTGCGYYALGNRGIGNYNIAVGSQAGMNIGLNTPGGSNIDIGNQGDPADNAVIRIGDQNQTHYVDNSNRPAITATYIAGIYQTQTKSGTTQPVIVDMNGQLGTITSSERFKKDIKPMGRSSDVLTALKPVTFHYASDTENTAQFGLIAEQVEKVSPDLVVRDASGEIYSVRYDAVNAMLLNEFLKQHEQIAEQQKQIENLRAQVSELVKNLR